MFFIGVTDCACLFVNTLGTGVFTVNGWVFCSHPLLNYWVGFVGTHLWVVETTVDLILALNRCVDMASPRWSNIPFEGNRTWLWVAPAVVYGCYFSYFTKPVTFSSYFVAYFFNPHAGYIEDFGETTVCSYRVVLFLPVRLQYHNNLHSFHNCE